MGIRFDKDPLAVEQNKVTWPKLRMFIFYDLAAWPKIPLKNFTLKNCLFGATNIVKNNEKDKWVYSDYGIAVDGGDWWNFGNGTARKNFIIFGVDNSSLSYVDNIKK